MYSTYGCGSLRKLSLRKIINIISLHLLPRVYYATNMSYGFYSTRVCGTSICNVQKYSVYKILRFIILFGIIFSETYIQHCQNRIVAASMYTLFLEN